MEKVIWNAARRLAVLVAATLAVIGVRFVLDARVRVFPGASACVAAALLGAAIVALARAGRSLRRMTERPGVVPASAVYRASARTPDHQTERVRAGHAAELAFVLLSFSAAVTIVAAAAR